MKARGVKSRAESYARGKARDSSYTGIEGLCRGWEDGYRAALRDVKIVSQDLIWDTARALTNSLAEVAKAAAEAAREELDKL